MVLRATRQFPRTAATGQPRQQPSQQQPMKIPSLAGLLIFLLGAQPCLARHRLHAEGPQELQLPHFRGRGVRQVRGVLDASPPKGRDDAVVVAIKSAHYFGKYHRDLDKCVHTDGKPLNCSFIEATHRNASEADAAWFHLPSICGDQIQRDAPHQLTVGMSMEASTYYPCMDQMDFMDQFDIEMTYRRCSHVQVPYFAEYDSELQNRLFADPEPFEKKLDAVAYINSNCGALNRRNDIVNQMMGLKQLPVDSWGRCLMNKVAPSHTFDKVKVFRQYKFCISMENSNTLDYVTEKIWHALESGCLPIYMGAPNIHDFIPMPNSIIDYQQFGSPEKLMAHLVMLSKDKEAYQATQKWRYMPLDSLSPGFRKMVLSHGSPSMHTQCQLCQILMNHRLSPVNLTQTHCLHNATWMAAKTTGGSTWGPGSDEMLKQPHAHRWSPTGVWDPMHEAPMDKPRLAPDVTVGPVRRLQTTWRQSQEDWD